MNYLKAYSRSVLEAAACVVALAVCGCGAEPGGDEASISEASQPLVTNLLAGPWQFASEDFDPPTFNAASVYNVNGNAINFTYQGKGPFTVSGPAISGIHFTQPVALVQGGAYRLQLDVSNVVGATPALFSATLSGAAAPTSLLPIVGNASGSIDFVVNAPPGASPSIELINKPLTVRPGIGIQNFSVTATLTKTN